MAVIIDKACSYVLLPKAIAAEALPKLLARSADETACVFETSFRASIICVASSASRPNAFICEMIKLALSPALIASSATF